MRYRVPETVIFQRLDDEAIVVDLEEGSIFSLNETGARLWEIVTAGGDEQSIRRTLLAEYDVAAPRLDDEISRLLQELMDAGLLLPMNDD